MTVLNYLSLFLYFLIALYIFKECSSTDLIIRAERAGKDGIYQEQEEDRELIKVMEEASKPIQALPSAPIDDPQRFFGLVMLAQQRSEFRQLRIPGEVYEIIHQYFDYNDIRTLFQMFTSPENAKVFGFVSYEAMHWIKPLRGDKVEYLKSLSAKRLDEIFHSVLHKIVFDEDDVYIKEISIPSKRSRRCLVTRQRTAFNWKAVAKFARLRFLRVGGLKIDISMDDIQKLPESLEHLSIYGNNWISKSGDVDLNLLPRGLGVFDADGCQGMNGALLLHAPDSQLVELRMSNTGVDPKTNSDTVLPRSLSIAYLPRRTDGLVIEFLRERGVEVNTY